MLFLAPLTITNFTCILKQKNMLFQYLQETIFVKLPLFSKEILFLLIHVFEHLPSIVGAPFWNNRIHSGIVVSSGSELFFPHHLQLVMGVIAKPNNIYGISLEYSVGPHLWQKSNFNVFLLFYSVDVISKCKLMIDLEGEEPIEVMSGIFDLVV